MTQYPLHLKQYFFTRQEVVANPEYNPEDAAVHQFDQTLQIKQTSDTHYGVQLTVKLNESLSQNPSYFFNLEVFAVIESTTRMEKEDITAHIKTNGFTLLLGAIRERLAEMTARGPWPNTMIDFIPIDTNTTD